MNFAERIACAVLWYGIVYAAFVVDYLAARHLLGLSEVLAAGMAVTGAAVLIVGVPWKDQRS